MTDLPADTTVVVDLVAEMPANEFVGRLPGYRSVPTLDGMPTDLYALTELIGELESASGGFMSTARSATGGPPLWPREYSSGAAWRGMCMTPRR